eukprot:TRINITY_DN110351_c0_g1_i1.p1 TRINITY_DN110351_c0_g1~~TRINITY_DN110351_c0_g1_i1.p1  ORF type:complete len:506 (+),score=118.71 TRINITY_DN110351_c0_g1_i1:169-1686(+)
MSAHSTSSTFIDASTDSMLMDILQSVGFELAIFVITLCFAIGMRRIPNEKPSKGKGEAFQDPLAKAKHALRVQHGHETKAGKVAAATPARDSFASPTASKKQSRSQSFGQAEESLIRELVRSARDSQRLKNADFVLSLYAQLLQRLEELSVRLGDVCSASHSALDLYNALVFCVIRAGKFNLIEKILADMQKQAVRRTLVFYESTMKLLAGQKQYSVALMVYDNLEADGLEPSAVTCSCLVNFAVEVGELQRAVTFFDRLCKVTTPSIRACMTVLRVHARRQDWPSSRKTILDMKSRGVTLDSLALNVAIATGVAADRLEEAEELASQVDIADAVSYNTLIKGYAQRGDASGALKILTAMESYGLAPNSISYNTAMDAAVRGGCNAEAWSLLEQMCSAKLRPDKFTCSILMKGLAKGASANVVRRALKLVTEVVPCCDPSLAATLYHAVLDAASQASDGTPELKAEVIAQMQKNHISLSSAAQRNTSAAQKASGVTPSFRKSSTM